MSSPDRPRYSILIPTRNGLPYVQHAIESVLSQPFDNFELVVSDNHSKDGTAEYLAQLSDPRLVKLKPEADLPMALHFEFIVSKAKGDWVTLIGDDDAVMPFFFEYLESCDLDAIGVPAITFRRAIYYWDGCQELYGHTVVSYDPSTGSRYVNNGWGLFLAVCSIINWVHLPQLYTTGLVRNDFIRAIKARSGGRLFHAASPDTASAAIMAISAPTHYRIEQPIFWTGTSPKSVGFSFGSVAAKARHDEFARQNEQKGFVPSARLPAQLAGRTDFPAVSIYDALLLCPTISRFWSSNLVRMFFVAGLIVKSPKSRQVALDVYGKRLTWLPFVIAIWLIKAFRRLVPRGGKVKAEYRLKSTDRQQYRTITDASRVVRLAS